MVRTLAAQVKEFKKESLLTPLCMIVEVIMEMVIPLLMASIVDKGVDAGDMGHIYKIGAIMVVIALVGLGAGLLGGLFAAKASTGFARNLRRAMFENIQTFSFANIDRFSVAGLVTRLTTDVTNVQNAYQMLLRMAFRAPMTLIIAMTMALLINRRLASVYLVAVVFLSIVIVVIMSRASKYFRQVFKRYDDLNASVQENVRGIRVVKSFVREDHEIGIFGKAVQNLYGMFIKAEKQITLLMPVMQLTVYASILLVSWIGAKMIVGSSLTTGELMSLLTYCMNILMSLMMLSVIFVMVTMSSASGERIAEVLNEKSTLTNPENPDCEIPDGSVEFDHVYFSYNETADEPVLSDITFSVKSGEVIGIIGPTGSSKSSLVNLISRLYDVTGGRVLVGGKDVRTYDLDTLRRNVAVVLQNNVLFSGTILDNLRWGKADATLEECRAACALACADEFVEQMPEGYETFITQGGTNISGGQKQRLCIARALLRDPKVLILDDSTSAVDTATDARIREAFEQKIPGTTKFIIAQRISSVQHADHILVLEEGRINGWGTHEELLASNEIYKEVYESQSGGARDFDSHTMYADRKAGVLQDMAAVDRQAGMGGFRPDGAGKAGMGGFKPDGAGKAAGRDAIAGSPKTDKRPASSTGKEVK